MSTVMQVEAYKSFYEQGMTAYDAGDVLKARDLLLKAAEMANEISTKSDSYQVKTEYRNIAMKILNFVKTKSRPVDIFHH